MMSQTSGRQSQGFFQIWQAMLCLDNALCWLLSIQLIADAAEPQTVVCIDFLYPHDTHSFGGKTKQTKTVYVPMSWEPQSKGLPLDKLEIIIMIKKNNTKNPAGTRLREEDITNGRL